MSGFKKSLRYKQNYLKTQSNVVNMYDKMETCLDGDVGRVEAVLLEHDLDHLLPVPCWVHGWLRQQYPGVGGVDLELFMECVIPE